MPSLIVEAKVARSRSLCRRSQTQPAPARRPAWGSPFDAIIQVSLPKQTPLLACRRSCSPTPRCSPASPPPRPSAPLPAMPTACWTPPPPLPAAAAKSGRRQPAMGLSLLLRALVRLRAADSEPARLHRLTASACLLEASKLVPTRRPEMGRRTPPRFQCGPCAGFPRFRQGWRHNHWTKYMFCGG